MASQTKKDFKWYLKSLGPGAILAMCIMGPGTMSALVKTGSSFSYTHLWAVILSAVFAAVALWVPTKIACVTGLTAGEALSKYTFPWLAWALVLLSSATQFFVIINQGRGMSSALNLIASTATGSEISPVASWLLLLVGVIITCAAFYFGGSLEVLKRIIWFVVTFMLLCFVATLVILASEIQWGQLLSGLIPRITPRVTPLIDLSQVIPCLAGIAGGAANLSVLVYHSYALRSSKWNNKDHLEMGLWDSIFHNGILFGAFSVLVFLVSAAVLYPAGMAVASVGEAAQSLAPLLGKGAVIVFSLGWTCAVATTMAGCAYIVVTPIMYMLGKDISLDNKAYKYILTICTIIPAVFISPLLKGEAINLLVKAMQVNTLVTPPGLLAFWYMSSSKKIMGEHRNGIVLNIFLAFMFIVVTYLGIGSFKSIFLN
ncbi:MAG: divalent metal cation transporter [Firmicutes bacterium]|jgi:Mn2+/Fe2+ NRAMP family transporter|nr:divalent metal cation transporter [Bacillota bacterium]HPU00791.1 divalent metal cation transporter [Bacillota bacterium]